MSMDFGFDVISAEEYERQRALYGPLTESLRKLIAAGIHTEVDEETVAIGAGRDRGGDTNAREQATRRDVDAAS